MEKWNVIQFPGMKAGKGGSAAREELSVRLKQWLGSRKAVQAVVSRKWVLLLTFMGFLLGKAMILNELSPLPLHTLQSSLLCVGTTLFRLVRR